MNGTPPDSPLRVQDGGPSLANHPVRIFPRSDLEFCGAVMAALDWLTGGARSPAVLEDLLRRDYPAVRVVEQQAIATDLEPPCMYVFRDGSLLPQPGDGPGSPMYVESIVRIQRLAILSLIARNRSAALLARHAAASARLTRLRGMSEPIPDIGA